MNAARPYALRGAGIGYSRVWGRALGAALLCLCAVGTARAQDVEPWVPKTWAVKAGFFFPTQGTLRNQSGSPYYDIGVDYSPPLRYRPVGAQLVIGTDFMWRTGSGLSYLTIPITASLLWDISAPTARVHVYGGVGAGIYFINTGFIGGTTQAGLKFTVGADITQKFFLEMNYHYVGGFSDNLGNGIRVDGLTFAVGHRF